MRRARTLQVALAAGALVVASTACAADADTADTKVKMALLLRSQGGTTYFQQVAKGARAEAKKLGADLTVQFTNSSDEQLSAVDAVISSGAKGIIVTIQDPSIGPSVATKAKNGDVALLASSDPFDDAAGKAVPVVTLDAKKVGGDVGAEVAAQYEKAGWAKDGGTIKVASIELPKVSTCMDRTDAARAAFLKATPGFKKSDIVKLSYDGTLNSANDTMSSALNNHRDVDRWLVWSCNDEGVVGALTALTNGGIDADGLLGVGLGANLACDQWDKGKGTGLVSAVALDPADNGRMSVRAMHNLLAKDKALPPVTIFPGELVTPDTPRAELPC